jgi:hypothetical protein
MGSHEDSFQTCINPIAPKACNKDFVKALSNGTKAMRFECSMREIVPADRGRTFILSFFLADDTIAIFERGRCAAQFTCFTSTKRANSDT